MCIKNYNQSNKQITIQMIKQKIKTHFYKVRPLMVLLCSSITHPNFLSTQEAASERKFILLGKHWMSHSSQEILITAGGKVDQFYLALNNTWLRNTQEAANSILWPVTSAHLSWHLTRNESAGKTLTNCSKTELCETALKCTKKKLKQPAVINE